MSKSDNEKGTPNSVGFVVAGPMRLCLMQTEMKGYPQIAHSKNGFFQGGFLRTNRCRTNTGIVPRRVTMTGGDGEKGGSNNVPINLPSIVLLLTSSVLAIASIGCVFELSDGKPTYGSTATIGILALSLPGFLFTFYAAIRKGQQEALEDP